MNPRVRLGVTAAVILGVGLSHYVIRPTSYEWTALAAAAVRVGIVLSLICLAYADLKKLPPWIFFGIGLGAVSLALRPRLALIIGPLVGAYWLVQKLPLREK